MSHTEYSAQFVQYSSVFLGLEEALQPSANYGGIWSGSSRAIAPSLPVRKSCNKRWAVRN